MESTVDVGTKTEAANEVLNVLVKAEISLLRNLLDELQERHGKEIVSDIISGKYIVGKSLMDITCALGLTDALQTFIRRGGKVLSSSSGYGLVHFAASWGNLECLELLYELNTGMNKTANGETPKQLAARYGHNKCADFLDWAESEILLHSERSPGKDKKKA